MKCIILCAGYATRLYPLTLDKPKALLPVAGKPILNYLLEKVDKISEIDQIIIVSNNKFYSHFCDWKNSLNREDVRVLNDLTLTNESRIGGLGDLWFAMEKENIQDDVLLLAGDNFFNFDLTNFMDFFKEKKNNLIVLYDILGKDDPRKFGIINLGENNQIVSFEEKPANPKSTLISTGIYFYSKSELAKIKEYMTTSLSKEGPGYLIPYFLNSQSVYGIAAQGEWYDVGSKEIYEKVNSLRLN